MDTSITTLPVQTLTKTRNFQEIGFLIGLLAIVGLIVISFYGFLTVAKLNQTQNSTLSEQQVATPRNLKVVV